MPRARAIRGRQRRLAPRSVLLGTGLVLALLAPGCIPEPKGGFNSPAPSKRLDAIVGASELEDPESLVKLVEMLRSPDPAERMLSIRSLEKRTGETLAYDHAAPHWQRIEGYNRWLEWLQAEGITLPDDMEPVPVPTHTPDGAGDDQPMDTEPQDD